VRMGIVGDHTQPWQEMAAVKGLFLLFRIGIRQPAKKETKEAGVVRNHSRNIHTRKVREAYLARLGVSSTGSLKNARLLEPLKGASCGHAGQLLDAACKHKCRLSYLRALSYKKVWIPHALQPPRQQTLIIFDWDDTLLSRRCVSAYQKINRACCRGLASAAKRLLELAQKLGQTIIVTNGAEGWVEESARRHLPDIVPMLDLMTVISARSKFQSSHPLTQWKKKVFNELQKQLSPQTITNFISIGDSNFERDAAHMIRATFANAIVKTVKLVEMPSPEELLWQQEVVLAKLPNIVNDGKSKDLHLQRQQVNSIHFQLNEFSA